MRKTIEVDSLVNNMNEFLANSENTAEDKAKREIICVYIEHILMAAKRYNGFRYITKEENSDKYGIEWISESEHVKGDDTRRKYTIFWLD